MGGGDCLTEIPSRGATTEKCALKAEGFARSPSFSIEGKALHGRLLTVLNAVCIAAVGRFRCLCQ